MRGTHITTTAPNGTGSRHALAALTSLVLLWGFTTVLNDVLVPHWKALFNLTYAQSLLVMMILGGALVPWVQAPIIDLFSAGVVNETAFHLSFLLPLACYAYLVWYGLRGSTLRSHT